jgi:hypothetical protein
MKDCTVWNFVGISETVRDALTILILTDDTHEVLSISDLRSFYDDLNPNLHTIPQHDIPSNHDSLPSPVDRDDNILILETISTVDAKFPAPVFDPISIIGLSLLYSRDIDRSIHHATIVQPILDEIGMMDLQLGNHF